MPRPVPLWKLPRAEQAAVKKARREARAARKEAHMSESIDGIAAKALRQFVARIERLNEEVDALKADLKEVFAQAKGQGFDPKTIRQIVKLRKLSQEERDEQEALLDTYKAALGMLADTPLGTAAVHRLTGKPVPTRADPDQTDLEDFTDPMPPTRHGAGQRRQPQIDPSVVRFRRAHGLGSLAEAGDVERYIDHVTGDGQ